MRPIEAARALQSPLERCVYWDCETNRDPRTGRWDELVVIASVDDDGHEIHASSWPEVVDAWTRAGYLGPEKPVQFLAHWGGIFDNRLLVEWALREGWELRRGLVSGGFGLWSVELRADDGTGRVLRLADSARIIPVSLANAAEGLGLAERKDTAFDRRARKAYDARTIEYCLRDCRVLRASIEKFREAWASVGVGLRVTAAANAATCARLEIPPDAWGWTREQDAIAGRAYYGGRVEVLRRRAAYGFSCDVVSSYPHAMTLPLPTAHLRTRHDARAPWQFARADRLAIVDATVRVPECHVGPLPYRPQRGALKGVLCFPVGAFRGQWTCHELGAALDAGARIVRLHRVDTYAAEPWCEPYVRGWYAHKRDGGPFRYAAKIALNSLSGKLCERDDTSEFTTDAELADELESEAGFADMIGEPPPTRHVAGRYVVAGRELYEIAGRRDGSIRHMAAAAFVTSRGRVSVLRRILSTDCQANYLDTDGIFFSCAGPDFFSARFSDALGEFQFEGLFQGGEFLRPKVYAFRRNGRLVVKAKGMRLPDGKRYPKALESAWNRIRAGQTIAYFPAGAVKSGFARGDIGVRRERSLRRLNAGHIDKRRFIDDNNSQPWNIGELEELGHVGKGERE